MKKVLRVIAAALTMCLIIAVMPLSAQVVEANQLGDIIGNVLNTNIRVYINGVEIMGYNIEKNTYVIAEDLRAYGVDVRWDENARTLSLTRGPSTRSPKHVPLNLEPEGSIAFYYIYTDVVTRINGQRVTSYNLRGTTAVKIDDVAAAFGQRIWDEEKREYYATTDGTRPRLPDVTAYLGSDVRAYQSTSAAYYQEFPRNGSFKMAGVTYNYGIVGNDYLTNSPPTGYYNLNGQYKTLSGLYGPIDGRGGNAIITITGDGKILSELESRSGDLPKSFSVDITGVQQLVISFSKINSYSTPYAALANAILTGPR
ncbi:MAG: NPCBM/NEW2 domain-containing protein [Oscillospiraceae bacterium]|nr:NPCBM/NEW2 domain-containing protein [Oscillospiraceae bacterium]